MNRYLKARLAAFCHYIYIYQCKILAPLPAFESRPGHVRMLPVTWGQAVFFLRHSDYLHHLQLAIYDLNVTWQER